MGRKRTDRRINYSCVCYSHGCLRLTVSNCAAAYLSSHKLSTSSPLPPSAAPSSYHCFTLFLSLALHCRNEAQHAETLAESGHRLWQEGEVEEGEGRVVAVAS